jgi:hypothetical protein
MKLTTRICQVFVAMNQFYLFDRDTRPKVPDHLTEENVQQRIIAGQDTLLIMPERNGTAEVVIEIHDTEPAYNPDEWDHVVEASLRLPTGHLQVWKGHTSEDFTVVPSWNRVRSFHGGFNTIDESGREGNDHYVLVLWPAPPAELRVIKQTPRVLRPEFYKKRLSYRSGPITNRVFFKVGSRLYCLWQGEYEEEVPQRDFALFDVQAERIIHIGPWDELPGVVSRLACERN